VRKFQIHHYSSEFDGFEGFVEEFAVDFLVDGAGGGEVFVGEFWVAGLAGEDGLGVIPGGSVAGGDWRTREWTFAGEGSRSG
jgi:hypothetical protein